MGRRKRGEHFKSDYDESANSSYRVEVTRAGLVVEISVDDFHTHVDVYDGSFTESGDLVGSLSCLRRINRRGQRLGGASGGKHAKT